MKRSRNSIRMRVPLAIAVLVGALTGCDGLPGGLTPKREIPWQQKVHWKAEDFFDDPQVIALCKAIEANDLDEMKRLIDAGANVNAPG